MRALRAVAAAVLGAVVLAGCGPSGSGGGDDAPAGSSTQPGASASADPGASPGVSASPGGSTSPTVGPTTSPTAGRVPDRAQTLVRVTRTGGFAGQTHTLVVKGDGSYTRLDAKAKPTGTGRLSEAELAGLSAALREADFARLPRIATGGPTIYDGYYYAFVHDGHEVAGAQGSLPPVLTKVIDVLPPFTGAQDAP
ncbi:hypothetical protein OG444_25855 [Streptomyces sp. NBC_01232]|uniref:hypothetical protein n=1 Tax=Streptomyces sp. NBC_01232 TaxID=2903786 RepID=UPI002E0DC1E9|nr:hypothetical protein OG444_25855 [Streptomyces sp. NBC_01232]